MFPGSREVRLHHHTCFATSFGLLPRLPLPPLNATSSSRLRAWCEHVMMWMGITAARAACSRLIQHVCLATAAAPAMSVVRGCARSLALKLPLVRPPLWSSSCMVVYLFGPLDQFLCLLPLRDAQARKQVSFSLQIDIACSSEALSFADAILRTQERCTTSAPHYCPRGKGRAGAWP